MPSTFEKPRYDYLDRPHSIEAIDNHFAEQVSLVLSQECEGISPFSTLCGAMVVSEIRVPCFVLSLTMVHLTLKMRPTKVAAHITFRSSAVILLA
jgi:hypothetical protein